MLVLVIDPALGRIAAAEQSGPQDSPVPDNSTAPSPEESPAPPPEGPEQPVPDTFSKVQQSWEPTPPRAAAFRPTLIEDPSFLRYRTGYGDFVVDRKAPQVLSMPYYGTEVATMFTVLDGDTLLVPGAGLVEKATGRASGDLAGNLVFEPAQTVVSYPLTRGPGGETGGTMRVTYDFDSASDKITAEFTPLDKATYRVAWIALSELPVVQTLDLADSDPDFATVASGDLGCRFGGCLDVKDLAILTGIGTSGSSLALKTERHGELEVVLDYSDASDDYSTTYAAANVEYAGIKGNLAMVVFQEGKLSIDPKLLGAGSIDFSIQRKTFFDGNAYWAFWVHPGTNNLDYAYSTDGGATWCGGTCGSGFTPLLLTLGAIANPLPFSFTVATFGTTVDILWVDDNLTGGPKHGIRLLQGQLEPAKIVWDGVATQVYETGTPVDTISQPTLATFATNGELVITAIIGGQHVRRIRYDCMDSYLCPPHDYQVDLSGLQNFSLALPVAFPGPNGGVAILYATSKSQLQVFADWVSSGQPGSYVSCRQTLDWLNSSSTIADPWNYIAASPAFDGKIDVFLSTPQANPRNITNYRLHPTFSYVGGCDWEVAFVDPIYSNANYAASHLSAGNEVGTSGEYLFWTNRTSSDATQRINYARIVPDFGKGLEVVPWMQSQAVAQLSVGLYASRFIPIIFDSGGSVYFATHLLASDGLGPSNPWTQVAGAPLLNEVGTEVNPATGLVRRVEGVFSTASTRGTFGLSSIYRQPSVFFSSSQSLVKFYRPPIDYGYIFNPVMTLNLPWIDVAGTEVVHFPDGQSYVVTWDSTCLQGTPPGWPCPTYTKYYFNNTRGIAFQLVYDRNAPSSTRYTLKLPDGGRYIFDDYGKIMSIFPDYKAVGLSKGTSFTYGGGRLTTVTDDYVVLGGTNHRQFKIVYVGTTKQIDYITDWYGTKLADYSYPSGSVAGCSYTGASTGTVKVTDAAGRTTTYSICRYVLIRVDLPAGGRSEYSYADSIGMNLTQGSDFYSLPVRKIVTYNETAAAKKARTLTVTYHARNGDIMLAEIYEYDGLGVLQGRKDYQFRPGLGVVTARTLDFSGQVVWYDMETMGDSAGSYCVNLLSDLSGNGNCGTLSATAAAAGRYSGAQDFTSTSSGISKTDTASLSITSSLTLSAWVKWDTLSQSSGFATVVRKYDSSTNYGYLLDVAAGGVSNKKLRLVIGSGASNAYLSTSTLADSGRWYHIAGVFDDVANAVTLYINGVPSGQTTGVTIAPVDNANSLRVGKSELTDGTWDGVIDEVHVFNRALTANEVLSLFRTNPSAVQRGKENFQYATDDRVVFRQTFAGEETTPSAESEVARDDWGNVIYSRGPYGNESFASYANTNHQYQFYAPPQLKRTSGKLYADGFDFYAYDVSTDGLYSIGGSPTLALDESAPRFSPSLKLSPSQGATNIVQKTFLQPTGSLLFEAMVRVDAAVTSDTTRYFAVQLGSPSAVLVRFNNQGKIDIVPAAGSCPFSGTIPYSANTWYRLAIRIKPTQGPYDVYLDGAAICSWAAVSLPSIDRFQLQMYYTSVSFNAWIDDVKVAAGVSVKVQGLTDGQRADLYSGPTRIASATASGGSVWLDFIGGIVGTDEHEMPGTLEIRSRDDIVEYRSPMSDSYPGDVVTYAPPRVIEDRLVRTRSGYGYWLGNDGQPHLLVSGSLPVGAKAGASGTDCDSGAGPIIAPWQWTTTLNYPTPTGNSAHKTPFASFAQPHCLLQDLSSPTPWSDAPASSEYYVQYIYFPATWPSAQIPVGVALRFWNGVKNPDPPWGDSDTLWKGAQWGGGISSGGDAAMGPLPLRISGWIKLVVKVTDLNYKSGGVDNKWVCNPTCEAAKGIDYVLSDGEAHWDATAREGSDAADVTITGLPTGGSTQVRVGIYYTGNDTLIPGKQVTTTNGVAAISLYPTVSAFPLSAKIKIETCTTCPTNFATIYYSAPVTLWGGDRLEYKGVAGFYENDAAAIPAEVHDLVVGRKRPFGDCVDASICYDMESFTRDSAITLGSGVVQNKIVDLSGNARHGTVSGAVYSSISSAASGLGLSFDGVSGKLDTLYDLPTSWMSVSAWIDPTSLTSGDDIKAIVVKRDATNNEWRFAVRPSTGKLEFAGWDSFSHMTIQAYSTGTVAVASLYHVAFTWDGTVVTFYINGMASGAALRTGAMIMDTTATLKVATDTDASSRFWNGVIDQVAVYGKVLTDAQVMGIYRSRLPNAQQEFVLADSNGLVTETRAASNSAYLTTSYTYDSNGRPVTRVLNGNTTTFWYAGFYGGAYLTTLMRPTGQVELYSYDLNTGLKIGTLATDCERLRTEYDSAFRPTTSLSYAKSDALVFFDMETMRTLDSTGAWMLKDVSCNNVDGTVTGAGDAAGVQGRALAFDGVGNKVVASPSILGLQTWTLSAWIYYTGLGSNAYQHAVTLGTDKDVSLYVLKGTGDLRIVAQNSGGSTIVDAVVQTAITTNRWYQVSATWDGTTLIVYLDGALKVTSAPGSITIRTNKLKIGTSGGETGAFFGGSIDEVYLYNRVLTSTEIASTLRLKYGLLRMTGLRYDDMVGSSAWAGYTFPSVTTYDGVSAARRLYLDMETTKFTIGGTTYLEDLSGNGNHVGNYGGVLTTDPTKCRVGKCYSFDGTQYLKLPATSSLNVTKELTVAAWAYLDSLADITIQQTIVTKGSYLMWLQYSSGHWYAYGKVYAGGTWSTARSNFLSAGVLYHLAMTYDGSAIQMYVNGAPSGPPTAFGGLIPPSAISLLIANGDETPCGVTCFFGTIDEVHVLDTALSPAQIASFYNGYFVSSPATKLPTSNTGTTNNCGSPTDGGDWTNPSNAYADDGLYATASPGQNANFCNEWNTFGFEVPSGIAIAAVKIVIAYNVSTSASIAELHVALQTDNGGTNCAVQEHTSEPTARAIVTFDFTSCKAWTQADFNGNKIRLEVGGHRGNSGTAVTFYLDYVKVRVTYTYAPTGSTAFDTTHSSRTFYDGIGRAVREVVADVYGNRLTTAQAKGWNDLVTVDYLTTGDYSTFAYDFPGRTVRATTPGVAAGIAGTSYSVFYDKDRKAVSIDVLGRKTDAAVDLLGRTIEAGVFDPTNSGYNATKTAYNGINLAVSSDTITSSGAQLWPTSYTYYDVLGRPVYALHPDGKNITTKYDNDGRVYKRIDEMGRTTIYTYDSVGRLAASGGIKQKASEASATSYSVDFTWASDSDDLLSITNGTTSTNGAKVTYTYDQMHQVASEKIDILPCSPTCQSSLTIAYVYDATGKITKITYPGTSKYVDNGYDTMGRLSSVSFAGSQYAAVSYDQYGRMFKTLFFSAGSDTGISESYAFDARNRITQVKLASVTSTFMKLDYVYDVASQITGITDDLYTGTGGASNPKTVSHGYDGSGRLTYAQGPFTAPETDLKISYIMGGVGYDAVGNMRKKCEYTTSCGTATTYNYGANAWSRLDTLTGAATDRFFYNNDGSITSRDTGVGTTTTYYDLDFSQRLVKVRNSANADNSAYAYDARGRRVRTIDTVSGSPSTTYFSYIGDKVAYTKQGTPESWYAYLGDRVLFRYDTAAHFHEYDLSGNTRTLWTYSGGYVNEAKYRYKPFGEQVAVVSTSQDFRFRFGGGAEYDQASSSGGLYHMGARFSDGKLGRFLSRDPLPVHDYAYAHNNPVSFVDPRGLTISLLDRSDEGFVIRVELDIGSSRPFSLGETYTMEGEYVGADWAGPAEATGVRLVGTRAGGRIPNIIGRVGEALTEEKYAGRVSGTQVKGVGSRYDNRLVTGEVVETKTGENVRFSGANKAQLEKYIRQVGAQNLMYEFYAGEDIDPDFISALVQYGVAFNENPYPAVEVP